jgi:hypothetical protein
MDVMMVRNMILNRTARKAMRSDEIRHPPGYGPPGYPVSSKLWDFQMILQVLQVSSMPLQAVQVLQAMRLALTPLFNIMFRTIIGSMGSKST